MVLRHLDTFYFRVKEGNKKCVFRCFSDLTTDQMDEVLKNLDEAKVRELCKELGKELHDLGDKHSIIKDNHPIFHSYNPPIPTVPHKPHA